MIQLIIWIVVIAVVAGAAYQGIALAPGESRLKRLAQILVVALAFLWVLSLVVDELGFSAWPPPTGHGRHR